MDSPEKLYRTRDNKYLKYCDDDRPGKQDRKASASGAQSSGEGYSLFQ